MSVEQTPAETTTPQVRPRGCRNGDALRVEASLPFVEALARRMAATMPRSIDLSDLVQDGVIGLIDAAERFDEGRGIKFETCAARRIRGAMIDALRKDAWPRGVRRVRCELRSPIGTRCAQRLCQGNLKRSVSWFVDYKKPIFLSGSSSPSRLLAFLQSAARSEVN